MRLDVLLFMLMVGIKQARKWRINEGGIAPSISNVHIWYFFTRLKHPLWFNQTSVKHKTLAHSFASVAAVWVFENACHRLYSTAIWYERHHHCIHTLRKKHFHQLANHLHIDWKRLWGYIFNRDSLSRGSCVTQWPHVWHTSLRYSVWRLLVITQQNSFWLALNESSNWKHNEFLCQTVDDKLFSQLSNRRK